jgi:hypothetical protein
MYEVWYAYSKRGHMKLSTHETAAAAAAAALALKPGRYEIWDHRGGCVAKMRTGRAAARAVTAAAAPLRLVSPVEAKWA